MLIAVKVRFVRSAAIRSAIMLRYAPMAAFTTAT
jgi:hypothetical protein